MIYLDLKSIKKLQIISIIFSIILGTLLHFTFELFCNNLFVASFSAVNESVWEHLKLVFSPMFIFAIIEYFLLKNYNNKNNYIFSKTMAIIFAVLFITIFFFTYTGIIGNNYFIDAKEIVAVLDISSLNNKNSLEKVCKNLKISDKIIDVSDQNMKSLILVKENGETKGYITNISSMTLAKRAQE